jgi:flagellar basal-body rod protein FlgG
MEVSQRISVSGMLAAQRQLDVVSNNLANVGSASFKRARAQVTDVGYQAGITAPVGPGGADVRIIGVGEGVQVAGISHDFLPGAVQATGNPLDVALQGDGFFQVLLPSGQMGYTRDGALSIDAQGRLVTAGGLPVQSADGGDLVLPADVIGARFNEAGEVVAERTDGTGPVLVGRVGLAVFRNNQGLEAAGQNLFLETAASGPAALLAPGMPNAPLMVPGGVEGSNVDVADEFTRLIQAQRGYQLNSRVVQAWDDVARMANELRR